MNVLEFVADAEMLHELADVSQRGHVSGTRMQHYEKMHAVIDPSLQKQVDFQDATYSTNHSLHDRAQQLKKESICDDMAEQFSTGKANTPYGKPIWE